ncbi:MAG TPA: 2,3,4,5-tetrahydropyridine-2,6-dicarboxylate N-succinyltransferase [Candidatus Dormibacteraeota bacterium]|nr:2,3,4,5-tetrahydropyridine-2,6-dicarboxylate N-succinyltransferase [Candidatus Dormibacteraeota bacterium]
MPQLAQQIEELFDHPPAEYSEEHQRLFQSFKAALNSGEARAAQPDAKSPTGWRVNAWVKKGILLGFRLGTIVEIGPYPARQPFFDKSSYPLKTITKNAGVRIVPGGSSIRDGSFVARGVVCMPPMFINVGAYVDEGTMVDSHALIGSCAQIGKSCHISAAAQIGGVIEPVGAIPVIIEDEVMVGGNAGVYEGTIVKKRSVLGTGTILNRSTPVYDLVKEKVYSATEEEPLVIPEEAIVVPGSRAVTHPLGKKWGLSLYAAVIVKYRDGKTDARVQLEDLLR